MGAGEQEEDSGDSGTETSRRGGGMRVSVKSPGVGAFLARTLGKERWGLGRIRALALGARRGGRPGE